MSRKIVGSLALPARLLASSLSRSPFSKLSSSFDLLDVFHSLYLQTYVRVLAISRIINSPNTRSSSRQLFTMLLEYIVHSVYTRVRGGSLFVGCFTIAVTRNEAECRLFATMAEVCTQRRTRCWKMSKGKGNIPNVPLIRA